MTDKDREQRISSLMKQLTEFADAVQVHCTWLTPNGTTSIYHLGSGNWYARTGMARHFLDQDIQSDAAVAIAEELGEVR